MREYFTYDVHIPTLNKTVRDLIISCKVKTGQEEMGFKQFTKYNDQNKKKPNVILYFKTYLTKHYELIK